ncbi:MAG: hypothetical protein M5U12_17715 [Verrucomicrobia bacterium]|nr:hypothetical protein [Verrucomicrobiota bacterium]
MAEAGPEAVVVNEVLEGGVERDLLGDRIPSRNHRLGVVVEQFARHAAEPGKRRLVALDEVDQALVGIRPGEHPAGVTEHQGEEPDPNAPVVEPDEAAPPVDLSLQARRGLEAKRRLGVPPERFAQRLTKRCTAG